MRRVLLLLCVSAAALAGCGSGADRARARETVQALNAALQRHDGAAACAQMSAELRRQIAQDEGAPCAKAVLGLGLRGGRPATVRVYADAAEVRLAGGDTDFLGDTRHGWRVQAVGCRPQGGAPYDCAAVA